MKNNLGSQKTCQGQAETVHAEVSFYNTPQYLRYHLKKSKCLLHLALLKLKYERGVKCFLENNRINLGFRETVHLPLPSILP